MGSSFPVIFWPFLYLGLPKYLDPGKSFNFAIIPITLPFIFGLINVIQLSLKDHYKPKSSAWWYATVGGTYGLLLSLFGNFYGQVPMNLFGLNNDYYQYLTIPAAIIIYTLVWRFIVKNLNEIFNIDSPWKNGFSS